MYRIVFSFAVFLSLAACSVNTVSLGETSDGSGVDSEHSEERFGNSESYSAGKTNINTATVDDLQRIPHVGASIAEKIIEYRQKYGPFKRPEQLILVQGISDQRFRRIRHLIRVK